MRTLSVTEREPVRLPSQVVQVPVLVSEEVVVAARLPEMAEFLP